jgi:UDP-N-acetylmuramoyl-L-alanyl-D-glutamate--2,6-diaminopimelate ligase
MAELTLAEMVGRGLARGVVGDANVRVRGIRHDSRKLEPGDVFVVIAGSTRPGSELDAVRRGAVAVVSEQPLDVGVPVLLVDDPLRALAEIARTLYDDPTTHLRVIGITGTNGKTTCSYLVEAILQAAARPTAVLGTVSFRGPFGVLDATHTTPMADDMMRLSRLAVESGATHLVLEVSSHGLAMHRVDGVAFEVAAFTNITHDHLDYHGDFDSYARAKRRLFEELAPRVSVLNVDDAMGAALVSTARGRVLRCSRDPHAQAEIRVRSHRTGVDGIVAELDTPMGACTLKSPLAGEYNLENLLVALGCGLGLGLPLDAILDGLSRSHGAPGRLERIQHFQVAVFVDYAHTPDALERVLRTLRPMCEGRLWCVFGCGGDRDRTKRPLMGGVAVDLADLVLVTSDNPRSEQPESILAEIERGVATRAIDRLDLGALASAERGYALMPDRRQAIGLAVRAARPGDVVLIAGKGHEKVQIFADRREPFDDCAEARAALQARDA